MTTLFSGFQLGNIKLKNKLVMAPLTRCRAIDNIPNDLMAEYYAQRAGAGLIITEGTAPSPNGLGYARIPGIYHQDQVEGWKKVTSAVHTKGGKIFIQLMHTGRISHSANMPTGSEVIAPSAIQAPEQMYTDSEGMQDHTVPREMTKEDIQTAIQEYVQASKNAIEAGFDGVELHAANGYLIDQFINPISNQRTDDYGGSAENRVRFAVEVAEAVTAAIGKEKVGMRISPYGAFNGLGEFKGVEETFELVAQKMAEIGLVYLHTVDHSAMGAPEVPTSVKDKIRSAFQGTIILSGGYDKARAEADLEANKGELVAYGRPFLANPDLVERFKAGAELNEPKFDLFYTPGAEGYTDYPVLETV